MKRFICALLFISIALGAYYYKEEIIDFVLTNIIQKDEDSLEYKNSYYLKYSFGFVKSVNEIKLENKKDIVNLYYSIINNGNDTFKFYCPKKYKTCLDDVDFLANDQKELSIINGYVHPYNSFDTIETTYDALGKVDLKINKIYNQEKIDLINSKVDQIVKEQVNGEEDKREIIRIIHDYIIDNTKYDKERTDKNIINYESNTAYGVLYQGYGICSGYADTMAIFLNYYDIPNFKIASENHVWNAVYLDDQWLHLDLTWDDPVLSTGEEIIDYSYFLITTEELKNKPDDTEHKYNKETYSELETKAKA